MGLVAGLSIRQPALDFRLLGLQQPAIFLMGLLELLGHLLLPSPETGLVCFETGADVDISIFLFLDPVALVAIPEARMGDRIALVVPGHHTAVSGCGRVTLVGQDIGPSHSRLRQRRVRTGISRYLHGFFATGLFSGECPIELCRVEIGRDQGLADALQKH